MRADAAAVVKEACDGVARVAHNVRDLKTFSRTGGCDWEVADPQASHALAEKADVVRADGALPAPYCCPSQLNQVFMSLLRNALQALDEPGKGRGPIVVSTGSAG